MPVHPAAVIRAAVQAHPADVFPPAVEEVVAAAVQSADKKRWSQDHLFLIQDLKIQDLFFILYSLFFILYSLFFIL